MKIILKLIIIFCAAFSGFSQTEKSKFIIGASSNLNFSFLTNQSKLADYESEKVKNSTFEVETEAGYFVGNNIAFGLGIMYSNSAEKEEDDKVKSKIFAAGPFAQYYFGRKKVQPFLQSSLAFGKKIEKYDYNSFAEKYDASIIAYDFGGGLSIFISKNIAIEFGLTYGVAKSSFKNYNNQDAKTTAKGLASEFGFSFLL